jgi:EmrB/QacA subfamily drug resistance transporter
VSRDSSAPLETVELERPHSGFGMQLALGTASYMASLNGSIVNATLPVMTTELQTDVATIEWVVVIYLLVQSGLLLSVGRLGDLRGQRSIYAVGLSIFVLACLLSGLAPSAPFLIGARALQAVGAAMMFGTTPAILTRAFPARRRGQVLGLHTMSVYLGLASGPPLGGWLTDILSWRAIFFANIPFGLIALGLTFRFIPRDKPTRVGETFDRVGAATYMLGLSSLLLALNQGHAWGWISPAVIACVALGLGLLGLFAAIELRVPSPMLNLELFRRRAFSASVLSAVLNYISFSATYFLLPFYLIQGRGLSPSQAGLVLTSQPIIMALTASFSGAFSDRVGSRLPATAGMLILSTGLFFLSRAGPTAPLVYLVGALAIIGLGIGLFTSPNSSAVMGSVPADRRGIASGVLATARTLGNVLGVALAGAIFNTVLGHALPNDAARVVDGVSAGLTMAAGVALLGAIVSASRPGGIGESQVAKA